MKGWLVGAALGIVAAAAGVGLWVTWDATQTTTAEPRLPPTSALSTTTQLGGVTTTALPPPPCDLGGPVTEVDPEDWATVVIDTNRRLPAEYQPPDLVDATEAGFESRDQVRAIVIEDLTALREGAEANGTPIAIVSGYRSHAYQADLYESRVAAEGETAANLSTARPGHSEHQLGTAIDVLEPGVGELTAAFADTPAGQWVAAHAHDYGFVISYPEGVTDLTCYEFEPWHLRYVGRDNAAAIVESGVPPRVWMLELAGSGG
jgi:D-alanyl-D-alanine carboxypeptidase